jgi:hypothetical protein
MISSPKHIWITHTLTWLMVKVSGDTGGSADASEYPRERLE